MELKDKQVLVFGTGKSGIGAAQLLLDTGALPIIFEGNKSADPDAVREKLEALGFKNIYGEHQVDTKTAKSAMMISSGGFGINLVEHKK